MDPRKTNGAGRSQPDSRDEGDEGSNLVAHGPPVIRGGVSLRELPIDHDLGDQVGVDTSVHDQSRPHLVSHVHAADHYRQFERTEVCRSADERDV